MRQWVREGKVERCPQPFMMLDRETGKYWHAPCRARRCVWCGPNLWKRFKSADFYAGVKGVGLPRLKMLTLTAPGGDTSPEWNGGAASRWHHFVTLLRQHYPGYQLEFWKVGELQDGHRRADGKGRGLVHYHGMLRGCRNLFIPHAVVKRLAQLAGFGPVCWIEKVDPNKGGLNGACAYLGKYLLKATADWVQERQAVVTKSRGWRLVWEDRRAPGTGKREWFVSMVVMVERVLSEGLSWRGQEEVAVT